MLGEKILKSEKYFDSRRKFQGKYKICTVGGGDFDSGRNILQGAKNFTTESPHVEIIC